MGNSCHCTQLPGCDVVCNSYRNKHHYLLYQVILHHTPHHLLHVGCHRRILLVQRNSGLIWPAVLCELTANCMVKTAREKISGSLTVTIKKFLIPVCTNFYGSRLIYCDISQIVFSYKLSEQIWENKEKCVWWDIFVYHSFKMHSLQLSTPISLAFLIIY